MKPRILKNNSDVSNSSANFGSANSKDLVAWNHSTLGPDFLLQGLQGWRSLTNFWNPNARFST
jgi:hypothetical protein